jgi:hypothetical protein
MVASPDASSEEQVEDGAPCRCAVPVRDERVAVEATRLDMKVYLRRLAGGLDGKCAGIHAEKVAGSGEYRDGCDAESPMMTVRPEPYLSIRSAASWVAVRTVSEAVAAGARV